MRVGSRSRTPLPLCCGLLHKRKLITIIVGSIIIIIIVVVMMARRNNELRGRPSAALRRDQLHADDGLALGQSNNLRRLSSASGLEFSAQNSLALSEKLVELADVGLLT